MPDQSAVGQYTVYKAEVGIMDCCKSLFLVIFLTSVLPAHGGPRFRQVPTNLTIKEAKHVVLTCSASTPNTNITWYKDEKVVKGNNFVFTSIGLLILRAYQEDEGWYVCKATNRGGSKVARAYLKVVRPLLADCGRPSLISRGRTKRIVGGKKVKAGSYPWQVGIRNTRTNRYLCSGSLIAERWVVTAAHCVARGVSFQDLELRLGKVFMNKQERGKEQLIRADRITTHPNYVHERGDYDSDLALIRLRSRAVFTDYVRPICLPLQKIDTDKILLRPGRSGVITGWGAIKERNKHVMSKRMRKAEVLIVDQATCKNANKKYVVTSTMFCAGHFNGTHGDACAGDAGGPLAIDNSPSHDGNEQRWVLAGIISWGQGCGRIGTYGVYTRVSMFTQWINDQIKANSDD